MSVRAPFAHQAARCSVLAPLVWLLIACLASPILQEHYESSLGRTINLLVGSLSVLLVGAGLILGIVGSIQGRDNSNTLGIALLGTFLNIGVISFWIWAIVAVWAMRS